MVLRGSDRRRQMIQTKFLKPRQKTFLLLAAKYPEYEFGGIGGSAACHDGQDETGKVSMIEVGDSAPSPPLRFISALVHCTHVLSRTRLLSYVRACCEHGRCNPAARAISL
jgi:hypothetical protein